MTAAFLCLWHQDTEEAESAKLGGPEHGGCSVLPFQLHDLDQTVCAIATNSLTCKMH